MHVDDRKASWLMRINNNIAALNSNRQLGKNMLNVSRNVERLSSGYRINRSADDAAGLAISEKMRTQIRGLNRASLNIQDGTSLLQVGDGAMQFMHDIMQRMRELAVQSANDTNELMDRQAIQLEIDQLITEIDDIARNTEFNGKRLFDGSIGASYAWHLGLRTAPMLNTPAIVGGVNQFQSPLEIRRGNHTAQVATGTQLLGLVDSDGNPYFPRDGTFIIQASDPVRGTLSVVLDFAVQNPNGEFDLDDFEAFFDNAFANPPDGLGRFANIEIDRVNGNIRVFTDENTNPGVSLGGGNFRIGSPNTNVQQGRTPSMIVPPGAAAGAINASTSIFGASASNTGTNPGMRTAAPIPEYIIENLLSPSSGTALNLEAILDSKTVWESLYANNPSFSFGLQSQTRTQTAGGAWNPWPSGWVNVNDPPQAPQAFAPTSDMTTLREFLTHINSAPGNDYFSSYTANIANAFVDRDGFISVNFGMSATLNPDRIGTPSAGDPARQFRIQSANLTHSSTPAHNAHTTRSVNSTWPIVGRLPDNGTLEVTIGNVPGVSPPPSVIIDFYNRTVTRGGELHNFTDERSMVDYMNVLLNSVPPSPQRIFPLTPPDPERPIANVTISGTGHLVITTAERHFTVADIVESNTNRPLYSPDFRGSSTASNFTPPSIVIAGTQNGIPHPPRTIQIAQGNYNSIDDFIRINASSFAAQGFLLGREDGQLRITTMAGGPGTDITNISFSSIPAGVATQMATAMGFPTGSFDSIQQGGLIEDPEFDALWIQSGANQGDGLRIEIPRLCARSLGLAMLRPIDDTSDFFALLGPDQYSLEPNIGSESPFEVGRFGLVVTSHETASGTLSVISNAINIISEERARFGAMQNRLDFARANVDNTADNLQVSESRIRDADMAALMTEFTKNNILHQSSIAMLSHASSLPQSVLQLLS